MKKSVLSLTFTLSVFTFSLFAADQSSGAVFPLGIFSFDIDRLAEEEAAQIGAVRSIGYTGLVEPERFENQLELLKRYQAIIGEVRQVRHPCIAVAQGEKHDRAVQEHPYEAIRRVSIGGVSKV